MGQYWQLINIDKRQTFGHWGKFQEILWNQLHDTLIPYLAIPTTPLDPSVIEGADLIGSWAGDRLICVGDYVDSGDYPKRMFTREELQEATETNLYSLACETYKEVPEAELLHDPIAFAHDKIWVLRNLSKQVYVHVDAFETAPEHISGPAVKRGRSLADVLLSQIGWSGETERGDFGCGKWAGHRFDIQTFDTVEGDEAWKDVSTKLAEEVKYMWYECDVDDD